jgi:tetratricopeptide (TPR) repeat protein
VLGDGTHEFGPELAAWLAQQRERRRGRLRQSLVDLCDMAAQARDYADALSHAKELLALEPLSEEAHRRVMQLHYLAGDRAAALMAFDRCEQVLKDEVGAGPSAETLSLLATVERDEVTALSPTPQAVPASVQRPPRMIGRDAELAEMAQGWAAHQVLAVSGEAGLGKSRLLQAFAEPRRGVVHVAARPGDAGVPFATLARLLRAVIARAPAQTQVLDAKLRNEVARVLPELAPALPRVTGEGERLVMQAAVGALLASNVDLSGLLVDDLHFADEASLDMLLALIDAEADAESDDTAGRGRSLRWALAYRPAEAASPLQALHDALIEQARLRPITLRPLDEAALAELVDSLGLPGVSGRALAPTLRQRTGGNPLFVLETLKQAWVERRLDTLADAALLPRPVSVSRLIERRIAQLSPGALTLARVASIAGVDFEIAMAEQVLGVSAMQFADALNELEAAQVLRGNAFAHDLVFEAVHASVPATIAVHTHGQVAAWLERRASEPARIARHWMAAQQSLRALPWLQQAAEAARRALRTKEYVAFLESKSAIEAAAGQAEAAFVSLLAAADEFVDVDLESAASAGFCDRLDQLASTPEHRVEALLQRGHLHQQRGEFDRAEHFAGLALQMSAGLANPGLTARSHRLLGVACNFGNRFVEAAEHMEACTAWFEEHGSVAERSECHGEMAVMLDNLGRLDDALPHHQLAYALSQQTGKVSNASVACGNYACNRLDAGDLLGAEHSLLQGQQLLAAYDGFGAHSGLLHMLRALGLCYRGCYGEALAQAEKGVEAMRAYQPGYLAHALLRLAECWWHLGQWSRVGQLLETTKMDVQAPLSSRVQHARLSWRYAQREGAGASAVEDARQVLITELSAIGEGRRPDLRLPLQIELAQGTEPAVALAQLDLVRKEAQRIGHLGTVLAARIRAAEAALVVDPGRARKEALAALSLAQERNTLVLLPAELWLHCGRALAAGGDAGHAAEVLAQGHDWVHKTAAEQVPESFRDSFLQRNPVNRALLALAAQARGALADTRPDTRTDAGVGTAPSLG